VKRLLPVLLLVLGLLPLGSAPAAADAVPNGSLARGQSLYVPVDPVRLLDTRSGLGVAPGAVGPAGVRDLQVVDGSRVPADATAVVLNVTATAPTAASTDVRVYPTPAADDVPPTVSSLNLTAGTTVANLVTVKIGAGGQVRLRNGLGSTHLVADLAGYTTGSGTGSSLVAGAPNRILDTRSSGGPLRAGRGAPVCRSSARLAFRRARPPSSST
jgi:hypothetical protein